MEQIAKEIIRLSEEIAKRPDIDIIIGRIDPEFIELPGHYDKHLLYYGESKLTDQFHITTPRVFDGERFVNTGRQRIVLFGPIEEGELIGSCNFYGLGIRIFDERLAFAKSLQSKRSRGGDFIDALFL